MKAGKLPTEGSITLGTRVLTRVGLLCMTFIKSAGAIVGCVAIDNPLTWALYEGLAVGVTNIFSINARAGVDTAAEAPFLNSKPEQYPPDPLLVFIVNVNEVPVETTEHSLSAPKLPIHVQVEFIDGE